MAYTLRAATRATAQSIYAFIQQHLERNLSTAHMTSNMESQKFENRKKHVAHNKRPFDDVRIIGHSNPIQALLVHICIPLIPTRACFTSIHTSKVADVLIITKVS